MNSVEIFWSSCIEIGDKAVDRCLLPFRSIFRQTATEKAINYPKILFASNQQNLPSSICVHPIIASWKQREEKINRGKINKSSNVTRSIF
mmetsp:Transcript_13099/g.33024  ORF Transcript_13099/g.33024 Transcript_13099/m.33024 type:complete len:90 (-) Transcript_13099:1047-1316(-)